MLRALALFVACGAVLWAANRALCGGESGVDETRRPLVVQVAPGADAGAVRRSIERAALLDLALERGVMATDPAIQLRLARTLDDPGASPLEDDLAGSLEGPSARAFDESLDDAADPVPAAAGLLDLQRQLHRVDPWIAERLVFQGERTVRRALAGEAPSDAALRDYLAAHRERYRSRARGTFVQVMVSHDRHPDDLERAAAALGRQLSTCTRLAGSELGDPSLLPRVARDMDEVELRSRFGDAFAAVVAGLARGRWQGPIRSSFGLHFVWLEAWEAGELPSFEELRPRLERDWLADTSERAYREALAALIAQREVRLVASGTP